MYCGSLIRGIKNRNKLLTLRRVKALNRVRSLVTGEETGACGFPIKMYILLITSAMRYAQ
jgi:hypothetical protein